MIDPQPFAQRRAQAHDQIMNPAANREQARLQIWPTYQRARDSIK
jgi:hypothetical protein